MSRQASYKKTLSNNQTEDEALRVVLQADDCAQYVSNKTRNRILELKGLKGRFSSRVFDLVRTDARAPPLDEANVADFIDAITLIEVKATKAPIVDAQLDGFFFGATANEYQIAQELGHRYLFAFVVLRPAAGKPPFHVLLDLAEVEKRTATRRTQFQVNFRSARARSRENANES